MGFFEFHRDMATDWPMGTFLFIFVVILEVIVGVVVLALLFWLVDSRFLPHSEGSGVIIEKEFTPAHTTTTLTYNATLKMSTPSTIYHPDEWSLLIKIGQEDSWISVSEQYYNRHETGDVISLTYSRGRFSHGVYIKTVR